MENKKIFIHSSALVESGAEIGPNSKIWHFAHIRQNVKIGSNTIVAKGVYIDTGCSIGSSVKIQNNVSIFHGVTIEDGVFVGPHVCFTNDLNPRAINPDLTLKEASDWIVSKTLVELGASIGANSTILPGIILGSWCLIGAGSVVTKNIPPFALAIGNPARIVGIVDKSGVIISRSYDTGFYPSSNNSENIEIKEDWVNIGNSKKFIQNS